MALRDLYQDMILDHGKKPRNFGDLPAATHTHLGHNPVCGDKLKIYVMVQDGIITDIKFEGVGCAISMASASLMTEAIRGVSLSTFQKVFTYFHDLVMNENEINDDEFNDNHKIKKLSVFSGVAEFPIRVKCATLAWHTLNAALLNVEQSVSTEQSS